VDTVLTDFLRAYGAEVYTPEGLDADDVVVLLAHKAGPDSIILSADRDMFRYDLPNVRQRVFSGFRLEQVVRQGNQATRRYGMVVFDNIWVFIIHLFSVCHSLSKAILGYLISAHGFEFLRWLVRANFSSLFSRDSVRHSASAAGREAWGR
jgi:hypothetical protein